MALSCLECPFPVCVKHETVAPEEVKTNLPKLNRNTEIRGLSEEENWRPTRIAAEFHLSVRMVYHILNGRRCVECGRPSRVKDPDGHHCGWHADRRIEKRRQKTHAARGKG